MEIPSDLEYGGLIKYAPTKIKIKGIVGVVVVIPSNKVPCGNRCNLVENKLRIIIFRTVLP